MPAARPDRPASLDTLSGWYPRVRAVGWRMHLILKSTKRIRPLAKNLAKKRRRHERLLGSAEIIDFQNSKFESERALPPIKALNPTQADYLDALRKSPQVIVLGPAGTGKTWIAATHAADLYRNREIDKIILTRPNVPCGRSLGYFPGSLEDKFAPWAVPVAEAIKERIGKAAYDIALKNGAIEMVPFEVMRGRSWKNAFVLLDEAQNASPAEIKTFLTRIGEDCTTVINGDISQCDLDRDSGLRVVIDIIAKQSLPVPVIEFGRGDIVRSGICAMWVNAFTEANI
jgi:phosphate starvation-inducible protein PhoH and related proteins